MGIWKRDYYGASIYNPPSSPYLFLPSSSYSELSQLLQKALPPAIPHLVSFSFDSPCTSYHYSLTKLGPTARALFPYQHGSRLCITITCALRCPRQYKERFKKTSLSALVPPRLNRLIHYNQPPPPFFGPVQSDNINGVFILYPSFAKLKRATLSRIEHFSVKF